jgi:hypothetical protein
MIPTSASQMSLAKHASTVGALMLLGAVLSAATAATLAGVADSVVPMVLGALAFYGGFEVAIRTPDWRGSLLGHVIASIGLGALLAPFVMHEMAQPLRDGAVIACLGLAALLPLAWVRPETVRAFGTFLIGVALGGTLAAGISILADTPAPSLPALLIAALLLGWIDFYWTQSLAAPRTLNDSVDAACAMFFDVLHRITRSANKQATRQQTRGGRRRARR